MKNVTKIGTAFVALAMSFTLQTANAQIVDKTKEKAVDKTNNRIDQRIDQGIDKGLDKIEGLFKRKDKKNKKTTSDTEKSGGNKSGSTGQTPSGNTGNSDEAAEQQAQDMLSKMFGGGDVDVEEKYSFDHKVFVEIKTIEKGKEQIIPFVYMLSDAGKVMGMDMKMEGASAKTVMDLEKQQMIILTDAEGMNMGMTMSFASEDLEKWTGETTDAEEQAAKFTKTGRTKTIAGYKCEEWVMEDEDMTAEYWVTNEEEFNWFMAYAGMQEQQTKQAMPEGMPKGMMIYMKMTEKSRKANVTEMTVTDVKKNTPSSIETSGYTFMNIGGK